MALMQRGNGIVDRRTVIVEGPRKWKDPVMPGFKRFRNAAITIAGIELMHRLRKGQFELERLGVQGRAAPTIWNAVLTA